MATRGRPKHPDILTPREWEVLALVRENLTNDQIGQRLGIGAEGAKYHVSEILSKLGLSSREEAAAWDPRQRPDWTPRWDPTRRPAWATALAPIGLFWRGLTGGLARAAGALSTVTSVGLGVALVAGITTLGVLVMRTRGSANDASATPPAVVASATPPAVVCGSANDSSATPPAVQSTPEACPHPRRKIAFMTDRDGNREIYVMNADGSGQTNLTNGPGEDNFVGWSPYASRIAFTSNRDGNQEIYVVNADGSGLNNLTNNPGDDGVQLGGDPAVAWSPDGSRIAFNSNRDGNNEIYVMAADGSGLTNVTDGSGLTNVTNSPGDDSFGGWSPDGSRIAFYSNRDGNNEGYNEVYVVAADGSGLTNLTNNGEQAFGLAWSPDGSRIAFGSIDAMSDPTWEIYVVNADGSGQTNLTSNPSDDGVNFRPAWSPDGSRIAFHGNSGTHVVNADGSGQTRLTDDHLFGVGGALSPDGSRIAFISDRDGNAEIYVVNADGSGETNLTKNPGEDRGPAWSPDSTRIAFVTGRDGNGEIYTMAADGSGPTNLTSNPGEDYDPAWSPALY